MRKALFFAVIAPCVALMAVFWAIFIFPPLGVVKLACGVARPFAEAWAETVGGLLLDLWEDRP